MAIMNAPQSSNLSPSEFTQYFNVEEKRIIDGFWSQYNKYVSDNFLKKITLDQGLWLQGEQIDDAKQTTMVTESKVMHPKLSSIYENVKRQWNM